MEGFAIVKVDSRPHRVIAQENWNLTNDEMKGMHVHHRIPRSQGGTNDSSNLYVCSPSFHFHAWHGADGRLNLIKQATINGRKGSILGGKRCHELGVGLHALDHSAKAKLLWAQGKGLAAMTPEEKTAAGRKGGTLGGATNAKNGTGVCGISPEKHSKQMSKTNSQKWVCGICGNYISNAKNVNKHIREEHPGSPITKAKVFD